MVVQLRDLLTGQRLVREKTHAEETKLNKRRTYRKFLAKAAEMAEKQLDSQLRERDGSGWLSASICVRSPDPTARCLFTEFESGFLDSKKVMPEFSNSEYVKDKVLSGEALRDLVEKLQNMYGSDWEVCHNGINFINIRPSNKYN